MSDKQLILDKLHATWQFRVEQATAGNQSLLGAIVLGILHRRPHAPPAIGSKAAITRDGMVVADYMNRDGVYEKARVVCHVDDLVNNLRGLADHLKLNDEDRKALFDETRKWIVKDNRAVSDLNLLK